MNTTPTLESVQAAFQQWRQHKPYLRSRIPAELRDQALALLTRHSPGDICKALSITRGMFLAWQGHAAPPQNATSEPIEFVALPTTPAIASRSSEPLTLALTQANGDHWSLQGDPSTEQLHAFVTALSGGAR